MLKKSIQILFCFLLLSTFDSVAQKKDQKSKNAPAAPPAADAKKPDAKKEPKPYKKVIDSTAVTQKGLIFI
jgi:hypothetical protein